MDCERWPLSVASYCLPIGCTLRRLWKTHLLPRMQKLRGIKGRKRGGKTCATRPTLPQYLSAYQIFVWPSLPIYFPSVCFAYSSLSVPDTMLPKTRCYSLFFFVLGHSPPCYQRAHGHFLLFYSLLSIFSFLQPFSDWKAHHTPPHSHS